MCKILILYYSMYGHTEEMARAVQHGAMDTPGVEAVVKRVPELMPSDVAQRAGAKLNQEAPLAQVEELPDYDAIIVGTPTRFGNMASQMRNFFDQTGDLWFKRALIGKVGSVFVSTGTGSGNETTITSVHTTLLHHGMILVGLPISAPGLSDISEPRGGSLLGAGSLAGADGRRRPSTKELDLARYQGLHVARVTSALIRGGFEIVSS